MTVSAASTSERATARLAEGGNRKQRRARRKGTLPLWRDADGIQRQGEYWFDEAAADRAVRFFPECLVHVEGEFAGRPFELEPWERDEIIRPLFGWKRADGTRRYRICYLEVPRKNGKSTLAAGIALYLTFADREPGAQVFSAAADREQASIIFDLARSMVEASPQLRERAEVFKKSLYVPFLGAVYRPISADARTKHGFNAHGVVVDELHAQPNRNLVDVLKTSTGARRQPLEVYITTAGYDRNSICWEMHEYAQKVRAGIVRDDAFLAVIYAATEADNWRKTSTWKKANPGYGVTIKAEYLRAECRRAQQVPGYENTFKRLHLNIWTEQASRWLPMERWEACIQALHEAARIAPERSALMLALAGRECFGGLDLASTSDLNAFVLDFPIPDLVPGGHIWLPFFWMPEENVELRLRRDRVDYRVWIREGFIKATQGNVADYDVIRADINELGKLFPIREIAYDRWNATQLTTQLGADGFTMAQFGQGFASMAAPSRELEKLVMGGLLGHGANPVLRWMASNVAIETDAAGNMKPTKDKSGEKIDGIVAGLMALARADVHKSGATPGYEVTVV